MQTGAPFKDWAGANYNYNCNQLYYLYVLA